jgi:hypothetical protein
MPKFRFNLEDHHFIASRGVHDCVDENQAEIMAREIADRLIERQPELLQGGHAIVVRDEADRQVYRAEMDQRSTPQRTN